MPSLVEWRVDERPPRLWTRLYVAVMWVLRDKRAFTGQEQTVWIVRPRRRRPAARVLYLHGGGYVHPLTPDYWRLVRALTAAPAEVVVPAYPLAPVAHVDDVVPRLVALARSLDDLPLVVMGDSAGGALSLVLAGHLRGAARRPDAVVLLSPWLDATLDEDQVSDLEATDPMLEETGLRAAGRWWSGGRTTTDPDVSPVFGNLDGLPPVDVHVGAHDILRPAVELLAQRADRADDVVLTVHERTAMFHVWMTRFVPEGAQTRRILRDRVRAVARPTEPRHP
ncbi:alpha/beta hydrolase fold domain-containing protein [Aeromicrobium sp. Sec7.5]|uniref:alpha/beta hydrolase fold domain-containing protein n=1 Tax=Aeromicrobium sp. Sec7.5 TaxID=3121276 RepID=UPI002FE4DDE1